MPESLNNIDAKQVIGLPNVQGLSSLGDDLFLLDVSYDRNITLLAHPCRIDAYAAILCRHGELDVEINLRRHTIRENTLLVGTPGSIVHVVPPESRQAQPSFTALIISKEYLSSFNFDLSKLQGLHPRLFSDPFVQLSAEELDYCLRYVALLQKVTGAPDVPHRREVVGSLVSSMFYLFAGLLQSRSDQHAGQPHVPGNRNALLFEQFMQLAAEYHLSERGTSFYAERLGLTPKYFSKLVKQVSGRSAPEWINAFVVMEAKSLLKYSSLSIKEIVFRLGFPNSSVFYKFFRTHTGQTPTEYREG